MELQHGQADSGLLILAVDGTFNDCEAAEQLVREVQQLVDGGLRRIILDFTRVPFMNSFGLGVLIRLNKQMASRGGRVKLCGIRSTISHMMHDTRLSALFAIYPDLAAARQAFATESEEPSF